MSSTVDTSSYALLAFSSSFMASMMLRNWASSGAGQHQATPALKSSKASSSSLNDGMKKGISFTKVTDSENTGFEAAINMRKNLRRRYSEDVTVTLPNWVDDLYGSFDRVWRNDEEMMDLAIEVL
jgi:hypothetical protein